MNYVILAIVVILLLYLLIQFPIASVGIAIGIGLIAWAIYEHNINKKLRAKSKMPSIIIAIGLVIMLGGIGVQATTANDVATDEDVAIEEVEIQETETKQEKERTTEQDSDSTEKSDENAENEQKMQEELAKQKEEQEKQEAAQQQKQAEQKQEQATKQTEQKTESNPAPSGNTAKVTRIVDGDTIEINYQGRTESVRLLLVDTPETKHPQLPVQPFGPEASAFAEEMLLGKTVQVEFDGPKRDKYDRMLAYLWVDGKNFNEMLLEKGLARYAYVYDPPYTHQSSMKAAEARAKEKRIGIWSIDNYVTSSGYNTTSETPKSSSKPKNEQKQTKTEKPAKEYNFKNCTELREVFPEGVPSDHPAYQSKMDRDKDNWACEAA